ncbi:Peroxin-3 [Morchella conica CCBAS932]|uniref:Peroxin-3 n=1 Tax=Morchella conica CCBAS932 TaxID=1392247 RepID=A0A3N4KZK9_9PEZI|nr:Peroxin-3 [Morchella conica CCBAS932]
MFKATRNFLRRNRTNFAIGFGLVGVGYLATNYVISKFADAKDRMSSDRRAREKLTRRFEQYQQDCTLTVLALLPTATEHILEELPVEKLTQELQQKKAARIAKTRSVADASEASTAATFPQKDDDTQSLQSFASESFVMAAKDGEEKPRKSKNQLWDEIKISSLTRSLTLIYTLALLTILTRVQLNLLGRKKYLSSVVSIAEREGEHTIHMEEEGYGTDMATNHQYLTFSWWLLDRGWRNVAEKVELAVKQVFGPWNARSTISLGQMKELTAQTRKIIEGEGAEPSTRWLLFLLPPRSEEAMVLAQSSTSTAEVQEGTTTDPVSPSLRRLLDETSDLIDSPTANTVMTKMLNAAFTFLLESKLTDNAFKLKATALPPTQPSEEARGSGEDNDVGDAATTKFASVLAALTRQAHLIGKDMPNEYLQVMEQQTELEAFSALVYSSNFDYVAQSGDDGVAA